jgi:Protein kinase domain/Domain of unknown function (DUF4384)
VSEAPVEVAGYRVERELGEGGMARVFRAYDARFDRYVALKILKASERSDPAVVARFLEEARNAGPLSHPNIVRVHRVEGEPQPFIDMELVEGPTLAAWMTERGGSVPWQEAVQIARDLASALEHAHRLGRVHRDVKPGNILMAEDGQTPKLVDFGIAMIDRPEATRLTRHGEMVGTPRYMAPEQVRGEAVDGRTDLYALGVVLYEMLTGAPAAPGNSLVAVTTQIVTGAPVPLRQLVPKLPANVASVVERLMAKDPNARFATAGEARAALEACMARNERAGSSGASTGSRAAGLGVSQGRRRGWAWLLGGAVLAAALAGVGWLLLVPPDLPPLVPAGPAPGSSPPPASADRSTASAPETGGVSRAPKTQVSLSDLRQSLQAYACTRVEADDSENPPNILVASADGGVPTRLAALGAPADSAAPLHFTSLPTGAAACAVFDVVNRTTEPVAQRFLRLEPPAEGGCGASNSGTCYSGLAEGRLAAGEHLVLAVEPPSGSRHVVVDYFMADGNVAHLYPHRGADDETIPTESYRAPVPDNGIFIGDKRAGAGDPAEYPIQEPFGDELIMAVAAEKPLFAMSRPFLESTSTYLAALEDALRKQSPAAHAATVWVNTAPEH